MPSDLFGGRRPLLLLTVWFGALTLLFTYPIWTAPAAVLTELADVRLVSWILAWDAHALVSNPLRLFDANIFFPNGHTLAYSESFIGAAIAVAPLNWAGQPVLAYNVLLLSSFVLSGLGAALWIRHLTGSTAAGIVAGVVWAFAPGKFDQLSHLHLLLGQWIPFALWRCSRWLESAQRRDLLATAAFAGLQFAFSMHYGLFLALFLPLYAAALFFLLPATPVRERPLRSIGDVAMAAALFALMVLPIAVQYGGGEAAVETERSYRELLSYSARPQSFLAGSRFNQAAHVGWLYERYRTTEANYFPGTLILVLAFAAAAWLLPRRLLALRTVLQAPARRAGGDAADRGVGPASSSARRRALTTISGGLLAIFSSLHVTGFVVAAWLPGSSLVAQGVFDVIRALDPAVWMAVAATALLFSLPLADARGAGSRRHVYLATIAYLALIAYLLALGPEVRGVAAQLGSGPYKLLYEWFSPMRSVRAVGRIGLMWILFAGALAGFAVAELERRVDLRAARSSGGPGAKAARLRWAIVMVVVAVTVWEYRVWPLPAEGADPRRDSVDDWLAEQPGDFAVVHVPIEGGRRAWHETGYMLGSTLHWKRLVNGYSGFFPADHTRLAAAEPLTREFFELLRADYPVRFMLVHTDRLSRTDSPAQRARLRRLTARNTDAVLVREVGSTYVFEIPRDNGSGTYVRRRYLVDELRGKQGIRFLVRTAGADDDATVVATSGWGSSVELTDVGVSWTGVAVDIPEDYVDGLNTTGVFEVSAHTLVPLGTTESKIASGFTIDVQDDGSGVGVESRWLHRTEDGGFQAHLLEQFGTAVLATLQFPPTPQGAIALRDEIARLPSGTMVAVAMRLDAGGPLDPAALEALRAIGVDAPGGVGITKLAAVGRRGALPGQGLLHADHKWAVIDIEAPSPTIELRGIRLY